MHLWTLDGEARWAQEDAQLWGQQDRAWSLGIELLKHNGGNKLQLCPTEADVCNLNWALKEAHFGTNGLGIHSKLSHKWLTAYGHFVKTEQESTDLTIFLQQPYK